jgi:hypothetical protein
MAIEPTGVANATVAEACAAAWDVLDDLAYGDWSLIDQAAARAAIVAIIQVSDARNHTLDEDDAPPSQPAEGHLHRRRRPQLETLDPPVAARALAALGQEPWPNVRSYEGDKLRLRVSDWRAIFLPTPMGSTCSV